MDYIDNTVDPATGTIKVRGILPNKEDPILAGMFVRVRVPAKLKKGAILVEEKALGSQTTGAESLSILQRGIEQGFTEKSETRK